MRTDLGEPADGEAGLPYGNPLPSLLFLAPRAEHDLVPAGYRGAATGPDAVGLRLAVGGADEAVAMAAHRAGHEDVRVGGTGGRGGRRGLLGGRLLRGLLRFLGGDLRDDHVAPETRYRLQQAGQRVPLPLAGALLGRLG